MRTMGLIGLVVVLAIVGMLVKKQLSASRHAVPALAASAANEAPAAATVRDQSSQIQRQYQQALDAAMQQPRAMPDEAN